MMCEGPNCPNILHAAKARADLLREHLHWNRMFHPRNLTQDVLTSVAELSDKLVERLSLEEQKEAEIAMLRHELEWKDKVIVRLQRERDLVDDRLRQLRARDT